MDAPYEIDPSARPERWTARWIWDEGIPRALPAEHQIRYFRRVFDASSGSRLRVHVSADSRYVLYLNGTRVSVGPCKGDHWRCHYETIDLTPHLRTGRNVLAARVLHFKPADPPHVPSIGLSAVMRSAAGGFLLQGSIEGGESLDTSEKWKVLADESTFFHTNEGANLLGENESVDGARFPHGWETLSFDDTAWKSAVPFWNGMSPDREWNYEFSGPWSLEPRPIPLMFETKRAFTTCTKAAGPDGGSLSPGALGRILAGQAGGPARLEAGTEWRIDLDAGELTTGYPVLSTAGGRGSVIRLTYAEAYGKGEEGKAWIKKSIRDDPNAGGIYGQWDEYDPNGGAETYVPFWFRPFRFVQVHIRVGEQPLLINPLTYIETGYPLEEKSRYASSEPDHKRLWDISVRTVRRCMHETFEDCPTYEQLQYAMDTRLEALYAAYVSADDRLMRKAIHDYHCGWHPSGLVQSRFPCAYPQIIPGFALHWILMVHDHWRLFGDAAVPRRYRSTVDSVLDWFDRRITNEGLVGGFYYWPYFDWVGGWNGGAPPGTPDKPVAVFNMLYATALRTAADLAAPAGFPNRAVEYRERAWQINEAVNRHLRDAKTGLYVDSLGGAVTSVHPQAWAILSGAAPEADRKTIAAACLDRKDLSAMNWAMQFFLFRALRIAGLYERAFELLPQWSALADLNVTTWPEDPVHGRSDCHGWGSVPIHEFLAEIVGVQPAEPGWNAVRIEPQPGPLRWAEGTVNTVRGDINVRWTLASGTMKMTATGPAGVPLSVLLPDGRTVEGKGRIEL